MLNCVFEPIRLSGKEGIALSSHDKNVENIPATCSRFRDEHNKYKGKCLDSLIGDYNSYLFVLNVELLKYYDQPFHRAKALDYDVNISKVGRSIGWTSAESLAGAMHYCLNHFNVPYKVTSHHDKTVFSVSSFTHECHLTIADHEPPTPSRTWLCPTDVVPRNKFEILVSAAMDYATCERYGVQARPDKLHRVLNAMCINEGVRPQGHAPIVEMATKIGAARANLSCSPLTNGGTSKSAYDSVTELVLQEADVYAMQQMSVESTLENTKTDKAITSGNDYER
jgi:hypothetical protein